jgi:hypothetical protein
VYGSDVIAVHIVVSAVAGCAITRPNNAKANKRAVWRGLVIVVFLHERRGIFVQRDRGQTSLRREMVI